MSSTLGAVAEVQARDYLVTQGLQWVESNYRCRLGEIDLIMRDAHTLVFIEVRARRSMAFGGAIASVTYQKQQKIMKTALLYLSMKRLHDKQAIRFDVVSLEGTPLQMTWIKDAFGMND